MPYNTIVEQLLKLLREDYLPYVKKAVIRLEAYSGERSKRAVHEIRNALDHIAIAVQEDITEEIAEKSLHAVEEHFRRAAIEPIEWLALEKLRKLLRIKNRGFWWWKLLLLKAPDSKEFDKKILDAQNFMAQGRYYKGISLKDSYENIDKAYVMFHELLMDVQPSELKSRIFAIILALAVLGLGFLLGKL